MDDLLGPGVTSNVTGPRLGQPHRHSVGTDLASVPVGNGVGTLPKLNLRFERLRGGPSNEEGRSAHRDGSDDAADVHLATSALKVDPHADLAARPERRRRRPTGRLDVVHRPWHGAAPRGGRHRHAEPGLRALTGTDRFDPAQVAVLTG